MHQEIVKHRQGDLTISEYYITHKALWDELDSYHKPIACTCDGSKAYASREEKERELCNS
jgi:hypothetical protein